MKRLIFLSMLIAVPYLMNAQAHADLNRSFQFRNYAVNAIPVERMPDSITTEEGTFIIENAQVSIEVMDTAGEAFSTNQQNNNALLNNTFLASNATANNEPAISNQPVQLNNFSNQLNNFPNNGNNFLNNRNISLSFNNSISQSGINVQTRVYPNPTTNRIVIEVSLEEKAEISIWLLDASGRRLLEIVPEGQVNQGVHSYPTDVSGLVQGMYFLEVTGKTPVTKRFVRQ